MAKAAADSSPKINEPLKDPAGAVALAPPAQGTEVAAVADDLSFFEGISTGFENVTAKDLLIPRLGILQGLSPQVTQGKPEYDPNARVGMIYDIGLQQGFSGAVAIIPVHYSKNFLEWAPRSSGKGLVNIHENDAIMEKTHRDEKNRPVLDNGNYIAETAQFYVLNISAQYRKSFIPFVSTQLKKARRLLTLAQSEKVTKADGSEFTPPLFYRTYSLTTVPESNNEGNWMGWKIERSVSLTELPNWKDLLEEIKEFRKSLEKGEARGDLSGVEADGAGGGAHTDTSPM